MIKKREMGGVGDICRENGTGRLTKYENGNEADGGVYHGMET